MSWPPVILEESLAMMRSIIHCKCCRCYLAVEMNNSDLLDQSSVSCQLLKVSAKFLVSVCLKVFMVNLCFLCGLFSYSMRN